MSPVSVFILEWALREFLSVRIYVWTFSKLTGPYKHSPTLISSETEKERWLWSCSENIINLISEEVSTWGFAGLMVVFSLPVGAVRIIKQYKIGWWTWYWIEYLYTDLKSIINAFIIKWKGGASHVLCFCMISAWTFFFIKLLYHDFQTQVLVI